MNDFWTNLYNLNPRKKNTLIEDALKNGHIDENEARLAEKYLKSKKLLLEKENYLCIDYSKKELLKTDNYNFKALFYKLIADSYSIVDDYLDANQNYINTIAALDYAKDFPLKGPSYFALSFIALGFSQHDKALFYLNKAGEYGLNADKLALDLFPFFSMYLQGRVEKDSKYVESMEVEFQESHKNLTHTATAMIHILIGALAKEFGLYKKVIDHNEKALEFKDKAHFLKYNHNLFSVLENIIFANYKLGNYDKALYLCNVASKLEIDKQKYLDFHSIIFLKVDCLLAMGNEDYAFELLKDYLNKENSASALDPALLNLKTILTSFMYRIFERKELLKNVEQLKETKVELKKWQKENLVIKDSINRISNMRSFVKEVYQEKTLEKLYEAIKNNLHKFLKYDTFILAYFDEKKEIIYNEFILYQDQILSEMVLPIDAFPCAKDLIEKNDILVYENCSEKFGHRVLNFGKESSSVESMLISPLKSYDKTDTFAFCIVQSQFKEIYTKNDIEILHAFSKVVSSKILQLKERKILKEEHEKLKKTKQLMDSYAKKIQELYLIDPISGLLNQKGFFNEIKLNKNNLKQSNLTIGLIDIVNFRKFNKNYGYQMGDEYLKHLGKVIQETFDLNNSILSRFQEDKFILLTYKMQSKLVYTFLERVLEAIEKDRFMYTDDFEISVKMGFRSLKNEKLFAEENENLEIFIEKSFDLLKAKGKVNAITRLDLEKIDLESRGKSNERN